MITKDMVREYLKYIVPTMITFTLASVYSIVDGVFVGHAVGDAGLAGINVAFPLVALIMAVGTGIGMGGGVISSIAKGAGDEAKAHRAVGTTFLMLVLASAPIMVTLLLFAEPICQLLGGRGETLSQAAAYLSVIAWGVPFQILVTGSMPLIRNQGKVAYAMGVQVLAGLMNVALDFVFVILMGWGTAGAALATATAQASSFLLVGAFFLRKDNRIARGDLRIDGHIALHALKLGMAPFGLTLLPEATVVAINVNLAACGGETALAAYAVVSYTACVIQMLIQGVGDGSQPLVSKRYGAGDVDGVRRIRNTNYLITISLGALGLVAMLLLRDRIPLLFGASEETAGVIAWALPLFSTAYVFYGFTHASTSYFYAVDDARASSAIVYGEALLVVAVVFGAARLAGVDGIWLSVTVVQAILSVCAGALLRRRRRARRAEGPARAAVGDGVC
ncbi:MATE family efflux transporter [Gordonibacter sp. An230]|uniref:MATE family efflux transporter n=1 Tax=Gordonibacter sp. An230 TaxID=1965592 RepID=UPI000B3989A6|nr:MATE family efflux transporter [Gordonibacter sp. An230]OUO87775.1 MATE family efflux transporter [Gordonibacter sp. An230]